MGKKMKNSLKISYLQVGSSSCCFSGQCGLREEAFGIIEQRIFFVLFISLIIVIIKTLTAGCRVSPFIAILELESESLFGVCCVCVPQQH